MRLFALLALIGAAAFTMGCAGSRAYNLYSGSSPLDESVYGVDQSITMASGSASDSIGSPDGDAAAPVVVAQTPAPVRSTAVYTRRTTLQSPPPPPPPPVSRPYRTASYRTSGAPVRTASTVRAPTRSLPRAAPVAQPAPVVRSVPVAAPVRRPAPVPTYSAPARPAPVRAKARPFIAPIRKNNCKPGGMPCFGGT